MISANKACLLMGLCAILSASPVLAADKPLKAVPKAKENIESIFCPAILDEKTYEDSKYEAYKMLIPGDDGWIFRTTRDMQTEFAIDDKTITQIAAMQKVLKERGIDFVMLYVPTRGMMHFEYIKPADAEKFGFSDIDDVWETYDETVSKIRDAGVNVVSVPRIAKGSPFFYKRDHHWNSFGAEIAAGEVAKFVKALPAYNGLAKTKFKSVSKGPMLYSGTSDKVFKKICNTVQPPEKIDVRATERADSASGQDALFGDVPEPQVVLMGTSNSTWEPSFSNFEGFLKEKMDVDILNMSVSGGGIDTALMSYLNADHYKQGKAKLLIWEVPGYYNLTKHLSMFRQVLPAIRGDCGDKAVVTSGKVQLDDDSVVLLEDLKSKEISGGDYYLYMKFDQPVSETYSLDLRYVKNRDKIKMSRSARYKADGEFYLALRADKKAPLDKVVIDIPLEMKDKNAVVTKVCRIDN